MPLSNSQWPQCSSSRAVVFNTEAAFYFVNDPEYRSDASGATEVYCDGTGLQIYILLRYLKWVSRRHGPDLFSHYLKHRRRAQVLLLGGTESAQAQLRGRWPDFYRRNMVHVDTSFLDKEEFPAKAREVAASGYDDVLIFLGLARQERFQAELHAAGFSGSSIGLGAAIDFLSGNKPRAGALVRRMGFEWLPRLIREPRMWPRVKRSFAVFLLIARSENSALRAYLFGK